MMHSSTDQSAHLLTSFSEGVLTITLNRPERRNALSPSMHDLFIRALTEAADDSDVGVVILTGSGGAFCAGGDVARMAG
jgi:2-(1,2-epoxy-1,2-dihydrophenyl)acetyl-CoA isomerase